MDIETYSYFMNLCYCYKLFCTQLDIRGPYHYRDTIEHIRQSNGNVSNARKNTKDGLGGCSFRILPNKYSNDPFLFLVFPLDVRLESMMPQLPAK